MRTFWLYLGNRVVTAVRMPADTPDHLVIDKALWWHERVPTCYPDEAPFEHAIAIRNSRVVRDKEVPCT